MAKNLLCVSCGNVDRPKTITQGSIIVEIILWACFLFPGFIYSVWRMTSKKKCCRFCRSQEVIPMDSPRAKILLKEKNWD